MKIAITGGSGFVGRHLAQSLVEKDYEVKLIARGVNKSDESIIHLKRTFFIPIGIGDESKLGEAFRDCYAVVHCAGINREIGDQTYQEVHIKGTQNVISAARKLECIKLFYSVFYVPDPDADLDTMNQNGPPKKSSESPVLILQFLKQV